MAMSKNRIKFNTKTILNIEPSSNGTAYYYDTQTRSLGLYVTKTGVKTYFVYRKVEGRPQRIILGRTDEITVEQAREKAGKVHFQLSEGINPHEKKIAIRQEMTLGELWELVLERHIEPNRVGKRNDKRMYDNHLSHWAHKKLSHITTANIRELHHRIGREKGRYSANDVHGLLRLMFNKAIEWGWNKPNPAYAVKQFKEQSRERFLNAQEMKAFLEALEQEPNETMRDYIYISLFTGARRGNVQAMRWEEIDFTAHQWIIPRTKNGKQHIVPLVEPAIELLQRRRLKTNSEWVFPSRSKCGHIMNPCEVFNNLINRAGIKNLRIHDLRRTLGSWQAALGANSYVIGKSLGHSSQHATAIYARLDINPVRDSLSKAVSAMMGGNAS